jgi:signal transduction histidine kinase
MAARLTPRALTSSKLRRSTPRPPRVVRIVFAKVPGGFTFANAFSAATSAAVTTHPGGMPPHISTLRLIRSCDRSSPAKTGPGVSSTPSFWRRSRVLVPVEPEASVEDETASPHLRTHLHLDELLSELQTQLQTVIGTRDRVHSLLDAVLAIGTGLDLQTVLRRIVEAAAQLVDARYGALGVIDEVHLLSQFLTVGIDEDTAASIGPLPRGGGILGLLIDEPQPLRIHDLGEHPATLGFPAHHPPMKSFLGVPIRVRNEVFGNLYLSEKKGGGDFDDEDESVVLALAAAAGVAIENARLYDDVRHRERRLRASSEVTTALLSGAEPDDVLRLVAARARDLAEADFAAIVLPFGDGLVIEVADGDAAERVTGKRIDPQASLIGDAFRGGATIAIDDIHQSPHWPKNSEALDDFGPVMIVPLVAGGARHGVLWVGNLIGGRRFRDDHQGLLEAFADQAALGLELARQRRQTEQLSLFRDRDRIARDLHDTVIQRLFATGMQLESSMRYMTTPEAADRVQGAVSDLDKTIQEIRSTIYGLQRSGRSPSTSLRARIVELIEELTPSLEFTPALRLEGLVDTRVSKDVADNLLPVLREALSNTARHAEASRADVSLVVDDEWVSLTVSDNGIGLAAQARSSGLANLEARASSLGGTFVAQSAPEGGAELVWRVPVGDS